MRRMVTDKEIKSLVTPIYRHSVAVKGDTCSLSFIFINTNPDDMDADDLVEALYETDIIAPLNGAIKVGAGYLITSYAVFNETDNDYYVRGMSNSGNIETGSTKISLRQALDAATYLVDVIQRIN